MEKEFIPYELALELKELGFNEPCFGIWMERGSKHDVIYVAKQEDAWMAEQNDGILSPLYQQAFRWFREKYNIDGFVRIEPLNEKYGFVIYNREKDNFKEFSTDYTKTEDAELGCLKKLIQIIKNK